MELRGRGKVRFYAFDCYSATCAIKTLGCVFTSKNQKKRISHGVRYKRMTYQGD